MICDRVLSNLTSLPDGWKEYEVTRYNVPDDEISVCTKNIHGRKAA